MFAPEFLRIFRPEYRVRYLHSSSPVLRKCCGCIHLRAGAMISCLIWMVTWANDCHLEMNSTCCLVFLSRVSLYTLPLSLSNIKAVSMRLSLQLPYLTLALPAFFSYMSDAAMLVFGTANLFFACAAGFGIFTIFQVSTQQRQGYCQ
jgi:hypothetical protein